MTNKRHAETRIRAKLGDDRVIDKQLPRHAERQKKGGKSASNDEHGKAWRKAKERENTLDSNEHPETKSRSQRQEEMLTNEDICAMAEDKEVGRT